MARPLKGGQKLMRTAKEGRIKGGIKKARRQYEGQQRLKELEKRIKMRPRRRGEPSLAGAKRPRKGTPSV